MGITRSSAQRVHNWDDDKAAAVEFLGLVPGPRACREARDPGTGRQVQDTLDGEALAPFAVKPTVAVPPGAREPSYEALLTVTALPDWV